MSEKTETKKPIPGKPAYRKNDRVRFECGGQVKEGVVAIVDAYGTFFQTEEPSYDVMVEKENCLYKHIPESLIRGIT